MGSTRGSGSESARADDFEQIEDLKGYFEESDDDDDEDSRVEDMEEPDVLLYMNGPYKTREELLSHLPERKIADRLITRYFASMSPSQRRHRTHS